MNSVPFIVAKKNSNFSNVEYSLYSSKYKPIFNQVDLAPTLSALLNIEIPRQNQGKIIDEIIEIIKPSEKERKLIYLDFRQQQQRLTSEILKSKHLV
jgi:predicted metal-dependent TIM-barrel fold hydrolase